MPNYTPSKKGRCENLSNIYEDNEANEEGISARDPQSTPSAGDRERVVGRDSGGNGTSLGEGVRKERKTEVRVTLPGNRSSIQSSENLSNRSLIIMTDTHSCESAGGGDGGGIGLILWEVVRREGDVDTRSSIVVTDTSSYQRDGGGNWLILGEVVRREGDVEAMDTLLSDHSSFQ